MVEKYLLFSDLSFIFQILWKNQRSGGQRFLKHFSEICGKITCILQIYKWLCLKGINILEIVTMHCWRSSLSRNAHSYNYASSNLINILRRPAQSKCKPSACNLRAAEQLHASYFADLWKCRPQWLQSESHLPSWTPSHAIYTQTLTFLFRSL